MNLLSGLLSIFGLSMKLRENRCLRSLRYQFALGGGWVEAGLRFGWLELEVT